MECYRVLAVNAAIMDRDGLIAFSNSQAGDEAAGILDTPISSAVEGIVQLRGMRVDSLLSDHPVLREAPCFLLKTDIEGYDFLALQGANELLRDPHRRPLFVTFEMHLRHPEGITVELVVRWMAERGYECFLIGRENLLPLTGNWWHPDYQAAKGFSNAFCVHHSRPKAIAGILSVYNKLSTHSRSYIQHLESRFLDTTTVNTAAADCHSCQLRARESGFCTALKRLALEHAYKIGSQIRECVDTKCLTEETAFQICGVTAEQVQLQVHGSR